MWTYLSDASGIKSQLDYILIRKKWRNSVKNTEPYSTFSSVGSDHRILVTEIKLSLRVEKKSQIKPKLDWSVLTKETELQKMFTIEVKNRFSKLQEIDSIRTSTEDYEHLLLSVKEASEKFIPNIKNNKKSNIAHNPLVVVAREAVNGAFKIYGKSPIKDNEINLQVAKEDLQKAYDTVIEEELNQKITSLNNAHANRRHKESWKIINEVSGRKSVGQEKSKEKVRKRGSKTGMSTLKDYLAILLL